MDSFPHRLSVLAFGTSQGAPIRLSNGELLKDSQGAIVLPRVPLAQLQQLGVKEIIVKNGPAGVLGYSDGKSFQSPAVPVKKVIDTTAAGDSFNGGYLAGRLNGLSPLASCQYAAALASFVVEHTGAIVTKEQFRSFSGRFNLTTFS